MANKFLYQDVVQRYNSNMGSYFWIAQAFCMQSPSWVNTL